MFDIVIPLGPNERGRILKQIQYTQKHVQGHRNIYLISYDPTIAVDGCITIDERIFPFMTYISEYFEQHEGKKNRNGWYFQQLLKLYASFYIPEMLDNYLVIDADVFFLQPISFFTADGKPIYTHGDEYHPPYFDHMQRLHPTLQKQIFNESGICHHMMFQRKYLRELFELVESYHNNNTPFWQLFISSVEEHRNHVIHADESGASEYEIYYNFMLMNHEKEIEVRTLNWRNIPSKGFSPNFYSNFHFVSVCHWMHGC